MAHFRNKKKGFVKHAVKKKQQPSVDHITGDKIPKSFVFSRAKLPDLSKNSPSIVLSGFGTTDQHLKLTAIMFHNIFPAIDINIVQLSTCQKIVLLNYNKDTKLIDIWHFAILPTYASVLLLLGWFSEDGDEAATVILTSDLGRVNRASTKSAVKLQETGPKNDFTTCQG
ncbi:hypothetical protein ACOSQ3_000443 [Xanthoceras sorbifolium]